MADKGPPMTPDPLPVALPELPVHAWYWFRKAPPEYGPGAGQSFVFDNEPQARNGAEPGDVIDGLVRKSDAEAALRAQAEEVQGLLATITTARAALRDMQHAAAAKPSCQFGSVSRCKCKRCADALAQAAIGQIDAHLAASKQEKPHG